MQFYSNAVWLVNYTISYVNGSLLNTENNYRLQWFWKFLFYFEDDWINLYIHMLLKHRILWHWCHITHILWDFVFWDLENVLWIENNWEYRIYNTKLNVPMTITLWVLKLHLPYLSYSTKVDILSNVQD